MTIPPASARGRSSERVLVLVRGRRDAEITRNLVVRGGFEALVCRSVVELVEALEEGAGAALLEEEAIGPGAPLARVAAILRAQPPWSDFPIIVFSNFGEEQRNGGGDLGALLGNVTFLDRPVRTRSMLASVHAAIRSRRRQYEARRAIEARDDFLAMLGHELRNPLGAIRLGVDALQKRAIEDAQAKRLAIVDRHARHLARLVDEMLDVARVTQGKIVLKSERLNVAEVARGAFDALEVGAREHGVSCSFVAPPGPVWVFADQQRLGQVFSNLITNAIKYTPRGGAIVVVVERRGNEAVVRVTDTGLGIAPEMIGHLFEAFAQADRTLARSEGGIGLGLALVRSLVELHGGKAEGSSKGLNRGSTFTVSLPVADDGVPAPTSSSDEVDPPGAAPKHVVVVEDSDDIRELLADLLECEGHQVQCAGDGPGGLETLLASPPDVAFIDLGLPGFDGLELARRARASGLRSRLVAVTGYGQREDRDRALHAGFDDHLTKPIVEADLQRVMLELDAPAGA